MNKKINILGKKYNNIIKKHLSSIKLIPERLQPFSAHLIYLL